MPSSHQTMLLTSSSTFIFDHAIDSYLSKPLKDSKFAYISTATKKVFDTRYSTDFISKLKQQQIRFTDINIDGKSPAELYSLLRGHEIIFVQGGNAFHLLQAVRKSGFKSVIFNLLNQGVIYIGSSAGSYIAGPSIITATWNERGFDRCGITDFTAMGLVPFIIKAHHTPEKHKDWAKLAKKLNQPLKVLTDHQALFIKDHKTELIGQGKEIIL